MSYNKKRWFVMLVMFLPFLILGQKQNSIKWKLSREVKLDHLITDACFDTYRKDGKEVLFPKILVYKDEVKCYDENFKEKGRVPLPKFSSCVLSPDGNYFGLSVPTKMTSEKDPKGIREFTVYNDIGGKVARIEVEEWWDEGNWVFVISPTNGSFLAPNGNTNKIIFYDSYGNIKKETNLFGSTDYQMVRDMKCTFSENGEYILVIADKIFNGSYEELPSDTPNTYTILFDKDGNELWRHSLDEHGFLASNFAFAISRNGRYICAGDERRGKKGTLSAHFYLFDNSGKLIGKYDIDPSSPFVPFCKFSKDEEFLIIGNFDKVQSIETSSGKILWTKQFPWNIKREIRKEEGIRYIKGVDIADSASTIAIVSFDFIIKHPYWFHNSQQLDILDDKGNLLLNRQINETQKADLSLEERDLVWVNPAGNQIFQRLKEGFEIYERVSSEIQAELYDITPITKGVKAQWSPDNKKIAYAYHGLNVIDAEGKKESEYLTSEHVWQFAWSPDSREIAYIASNHSTERRDWLYWVKIVDIETGKIRTIYEPQDRIVGKIWWLDDSNIGFFEESEVPSEHKWVVLDRFGKVPKKITSNEKIVYAYDVWDTLRIMNADGTEKHGLIYPKKTRIGFMAPVWSKATGQIAVRVISDSSHIEITDENGKSWKYLLYMGEFPQWSPDGKWIICNISVSGPTEHEIMSELYLISTDGKHKFQLTKTSDEAEVNPKWSPNGNKILFEGATSGNIFIAKIKINN
jgi:Tol biopolymer transport system component